jgi:hypothetical protein
MFPLARSAFRCRGVAGNTAAATWAEPSSAAQGGSANRVAGLVGRPLAVALARTWPRPALPAHDWSAPPSPLSGDLSP